jgi:hypothetical protein
MAASVFHLELRHFPHTARAFNLSREEVHARFIGPWLRGQVVELDDQRFAPERASLKIYEGRLLRTEELGYGRGWANATRTGEEVTERELAAAGPEAARGVGAVPPGLTGLKGELLALCEVGTVSLPQTLALASGAMPTARVSQRLANAELAVWELLHEGRIRLVRPGGEEIDRAEWQPILLASASWCDPAAKVLLAAGGE